MSARVVFWDELGLAATMTRKFAMHGLKPVQYCMLAFSPGARLQPACPNVFLENIRPGYAKRQSLMSDARRAPMGSGGPAPHRHHAGLISSSMGYVPPFAIMKRWIERCVTAETTRLQATFDDVLDVLKGLLKSVPVDEDWYKAQYPAVAEFIVRMSSETATSHFQKHGYFEGRKPFAVGWRGLTGPVPFAELKPRLQVNPRRGRLLVDVEIDDFLDLVKQILRAVPVDEAWYRNIYPAAAKSIDSGTFASANDHYAGLGYFEGRLPFDIVVDDAWYVSRYDHVRAGLERGVASSAKDHFMRVGYTEGCRPTPP